MDKDELTHHIQHVIGQYRLTGVRGAGELWLHPKDARKVGEAVLKDLGMAYRTDSKLTRGIPIIKPMGNLHV